LIRGPDPGYALSAVTESPEKQLPSLGEVEGDEPPVVHAETPAPSDSAAKTRRLSPRAWAIACAGIGGAATAGLLALLTMTESARPRAAAPVPIETFEAGAAAPAVAVAPASDAGSVPGVNEAATKPVPPPAWRVARLTADPSVTVTEGTIAKKTFQGALAAAGIPAKEIQRIVKAFAGVHRFEHLGASDTFSVARDRASGRVIAFELVSSPVEIWQAREDDGKLEGKKLELYVDHKRAGAAFVVGEDLKASVKQAGLREQLLDVLDDALDGHVGLADLRPGARLRILADEEWVEGAFTRYSDLLAVEYVPAPGRATPEDDKRGPLRVYHFAKEDRKEHLAYFDAKGQHPLRGGWRSPVPMARVTSRFNPHRMHPVLHVVTPHNGIDFGASTGTPVYAAGAGTIDSVGDGGPCGNMVQVHHPNGLTTAYCHLSRFAPGIHPGMRVEPRQLIGYVGQTGRATGPHLHFAVRRGDIFLDPLTLKMDGFRVVPPRDRDEFSSLRAALDLALDAIPLPAPPSAAVVAVDAGAEPEDFENH
jgi:murein DD-endopeptidase MepM/ murein hydrolase activator NlpD